MELLVRRGANVNCRTISGLTPILLAGSCLTPRYPVIRILLDQGANPNVSSPAGTTPLMDICGR
jgi:ankyrin repeat protein